ncbi:hypothetical protein FA95DRAFT_1577834 [Auriscalpium vulgare]|uniref:Uncharacterized protein n=1 Tax=Auriscalpium vulgare TaxID=40419 RepID=A0ACB8R584_9AGAM|nr:hypothetical protein FA95DRAFT_1577834 [Auriscalpium vulgare]
MANANVPHGVPVSPPPAPDAPRVSSRRRFAFYAVVQGLMVGVFREWLTASALIVGWPGAQFREYHTFEEAQAAYHSGMAANPHPPAEHPSSLIFHFANPAADAAKPEDDPAKPPADGAAPAAGGNAPATGDVSATPLATVPFLATPGATAAPHVTAAPHATAASPASAVPPPFVVDTTRQAAPATHPSVAEAYLEELSTVMHNMNVDTLVSLLQDRVDGMTPAVMTLLLAVRPNRRRGDGHQQVSAVEGTSVVRGERQGPEAAGSVVEMSGDGCSTIRLCLGAADVMWRTTKVVRQWMLEMQSPKYETRRLGMMLDKRRIFRKAVG